MFFKIFNFNSETSSLYVILNKPNGFICIQFITTIFKFVNS